MWISERARALRDAVRAPVSGARMTSARAGEPTPPGILRRRFAALGASVLLACGATVVAAAPASADESVSVTGASLQFRSYGDIFIIRDTACDGHSVYYQYALLGTTDGFKRQNLSTGCNTSGTFDLDLPEDIDVQFRVCVDIQFSGDRCSSYVFDSTS
jgi:hypothetical protein